MLARETLTVRSLRTVCAGSLLIAVTVLSTTGCDKGGPDQKPPGSTATQPAPPAGGSPAGVPEAPEVPLVWVKTEVEGVEVQMPGGEQATARVLDAKLKLPEGVTAIGPVVMVEVADGASYPRGVRMRLPEGVDPGTVDGKLALACATLSYSQSTRTATGGCYVHAATVDSETRTVAAPTSHASAWTIVTTKDEPTKFVNDHFRIHYDPKKVDPGHVLEAGNALKAAYVKLESFGLRFGRNPENRLDVYFQAIRSSKGVTYAGHQLSKGGGTFILFNLPSNIPNYNAAEMRITVAHELFHELQFKYENISTFKDVNVIGLQKISTTWYLNPSGWLVDKIFDLPKYDYPLGWLNEALSTWFQLRFDPTWQPEIQAPLYGNALDFLTKGLGGLHTDDGYGGAILFDYLVRRAGTDLVREILLACKKQGRNRNALAAVKDGLLRCAVLKQDPSLATFDDLWWDFTRELLRDDATRFDSRIDRRRMVPARPAESVPVGKEPVKRKYVVRVAPYAARVQVYRVQPPKPRTKAAQVICKVQQIPAEPKPFTVWGAVFASPARPGARGAVPSGSDRERLLTPKLQEAIVKLEIPKGQREAVLRILSTGVWDGSVPKAGDTCQVAYEVTFILTDDTPRETSGFFPEVRYFPGYHGPWQISPGKITDGKTKRVTSMSRTYFYRKFKPDGGRPDILLLFRVRVMIFSAPALAEAAFDSQQKKLPKDPRVAGLVKVPIGEEAVAYQMKGVKEFYDKEVQTREVVLLRQDKYTAEVSWSSFKTRDLWKNRRDITRGMAKEVAGRIAGTFHPIYALPPGGDAMARAQGDAANITDPPQARPVIAYAMAVSHAATQRFHEPWFDQIVQLQAAAVPARAELAEKYKALVRPTKIRKPFDDANRIMKAMQAQKAKWLDTPEDKRSPIARHELTEYDRKLAAVQAVAALADVPKQVWAEWAKAGAREEGSRPNSPTSLIAPPLWPNPSKNPDPNEAGDGLAVYKAKRKIWARVTTTPKPEVMQKRLEAYGKTVQAVLAVHAMKDNVNLYNKAAAEYNKRIEARDYGHYRPAIKDTPESP